jgi:hypothetical protein
MSVQKNKKNTVKLKKAPKEKGFKGSLLLESEPFEYTHDYFLDKIGFEKENRPVFVMKPLNARQRHFMDQDEKHITAEGMLWAKSKGIEFKETSKDKEMQYLLINKFSEFSDVEGRFEIVRQNIIKIKNMKAKFDENGLDKDIFDRLPNEIKNMLDAELNKRASLTNSEVLGL